MSKNKFVRVIYAILLLILLPLYLIYNIIKYFIDEKIKERKKF